MLVDIASRPSPPKCTINKSDSLRLEPPKLGGLTSAIYQRLEFTYEHVMILYNGTRIPSAATLSSLGVQDRDQIDMFVRHNPRRKAGIILRNPLPLQVDIPLELSASWGDAQSFLPAFTDRFVREWLANYVGDNALHFGQPFVDWIAGM